MKVARRGIGTVVVAGILVVLVVVAAGAFLVLYSGFWKGTSTTSVSSSFSTSSAISSNSSTTSSSSSTSSSTSTTSSSSSTSSTRSVSTCTSTTTLTGKTPPYDPVPLFQNYSAISMFLNDSYKDNSGVNHVEALTASYRVEKTPSNSSGYYKVGLNESESGTAISYTFYFLPNGTLSIVTFLGKNSTGSQLGLFSVFLTVTFELVDASSHAVQVTISPAYVHVLNVTSTRIGGTPVNITFYATNYTPFVQCGTTAAIDSELIGVGSFTGLKDRLLVYTRAIQTEFLALYPTYLTVQVLSVTKA